MRINKYEIDGFLLKSRLTNRNMTIRDLAAATGLSIYTLNAICSNNYTPTIKNIRVISHVLELGQNDIFNIFFKRMWNVNYRDLVDMQQAKKENRKKYIKKVDPNF